MGKMMRWRCQGKKEQQKVIILANYLLETVMSVVAIAGEGKEEPAIFGVANGTAPIRSAGPSQNGVE